MTFAPIEIVLTVLALVLVPVAIVFLLRMHPHRFGQTKLRSGKKYVRMFQQAGQERLAQTILAERPQLGPTRSIKLLSSEMREYFILIWRTIQAQFFENPAYAVIRADNLLGQVMLAKGYPMVELIENGVDFSDDHPEILQYYRTAHDIAVNHLQGEATPADLRMAMINFGALFDDLVNEPVTQSRLTVLRF